MDDTHFKILDRLSSASRRIEELERENVDLKDLLERVYAEWTHDDGLIASDIRLAEKVKKTIKQ